MKKNLFFIVFFILFGISSPVFSQFSDYFEDGDFTNNPCWLGNTEKFEVDFLKRLHLNAARETSDARLFTPSSLTKNTSWEFDVKMQIGPTSGNYVKVYLCADTTATGSLWGLCLRIGHDADKRVALWYEPLSGAGKNLLKGTQYRLTVDTLAISIKATLDWNGNFHLYTKLAGETDYTLEGDTLIGNSNIPQSKYFGVYCKYSSTRSTNTYFFDNFQVTPLSETLPPDEGLAAEPRDVVINEILYQPFASEGDEYVEIYNRSDKLIDIPALSIATRKADGALQRIKPLTSTANILYPGEYLVITGTKEKVCDFYTCYSDLLYCALGSMIPLSDEGSTIVLFNNQNNVVTDEITYTNKMHVSGLNDTRGVSLERIDPDVETNNRSNWASASALSGSGTPGYQNSQYKIVRDDGDDTGIKIVEPNPSEGEKFFRILYNLTGTDNRCNLKIFDSSGRLIENVLNNNFIGSNGSLKWSPSDSLRPGIYIMFMEIFRPSTGKVEKHKLPVVLRY